MALLSAADTSYSASLDAYNYGVKNLVDVVTRRNNWHWHGSHRFPRAPRCLRKRSAWNRCPGICCGICNPRLRRKESDK
jgi:hypothetical protein